MDMYRKVRLACAGGMSQREAARHFNISRDSVAKMMAFSVPPGYRRQAAVKRPKLDGSSGIIDAWLDGDQDVHRKQRHTAKRMFERLRAEHGFTGGYTIVKDYMRGREMFVPLAHPPGHAQADFGEATAIIIGGIERKAHFFVMDLPHSDACYVRAYPAATAEAWVDGHLHAFAFFGKVPASILYDNDRCLVARILPHDRGAKDPAGTSPEDAEVADLASREYDKLARQCAAEGRDHVRFLTRLVELGLIDRERRRVERRRVERRIKAAKFPATKSLDSFDFKAIPKLNKMQVLELARCEWIERRENVIALGPSGTGKTHVALGLGLAACQKGLSVGFTTAAALVNELMEARDERRLLRLQKQIVGHKLLIIDALGFVPLRKTGTELLFALISQRYERGATLITSNLPSDEWTETFGSERLTGALLDRLTHHVHILETNSDSYRLGQSRSRKAAPST